VEILYLAAYDDIMMMIKIIIIIIIIIIMTYCNNTRNFSGKYWAIVCPKFPGLSRDSECRGSSVVAVFAE